MKLLLIFFGMQKTVFLRLSVFSFFLELALHGRFSLFVLIPKRLALKSISAI